MNYYWETKCPTCKNAVKKHIGKSSAGWCFSLHIYPDEGIHDLSDWNLKFYSSNFGKIINEDGKKISIKKMLKTITERSCEPYLFSVEEMTRMMNQNDASPGPNNLWRAKIDGINCVGHGGGTWDLIVGDFS